MFVGSHFHIWYYWYLAVTVYWEWSTNLGSLVASATQWTTHLEKHLTKFLGSCSCTAFLRQQTCLEEPQ